VLEAVGAERGARRGAHRLGHPIDGVGGAGRLEEREPHVLVLLEPDLHLLADVHVVDLTADDVRREVDARVLGERDVRDHVGRLEARQPLVVVDGEADHRAPPGHLRRGG
jgi:hypothetical protein